MTERPWNFSAGPAVLPRSVLLHAQRDLVELPGLGVSPLEISHRSGWFDDVITEAAANIRGLLAVPDGYAVVFCQGGASQQFSMVAANLLRGNPDAACTIITGSWGERALVEARKEGFVDVVWSGEAEGYVRAPGPADVTIPARAAYLHITSNETIQGVEFPDDTEPVVPPDVPLVCDMSSDFLSRPVAIARYGLVYAGAQKNAGPAGVTVAIVREELLERVPDGLPSMLDYRTYVRSGSLFNTPPVFSIYVLLLVTRWLQDDVGGLTAQRDENRRKAGLVYDAIDDSDGFYRGHADRGSRSSMNVTWRLPSVALEGRFLAEASEEGLVELQGHRSVGGIRASLYNAMPLEGARALSDFMRSFAGRA